MTSHLARGRQARVPNVSAYAPCLNSVAPPGFALTTAALVLQLSSPPSQLLSSTARGTARGSHSCCLLLLSEAFCRRPISSMLMQDASQHRITPPGFGPPSCGVTARLEML